MDTNTILYAAIAVVVLFLAARLFGARKAPAAVVLEKIRSGARVIDVRSPGEYASGAYPKAKNIPVDTLASRLGELKKDAPVVLYCASGARSASAAKLLKKAGFTDVTNAGGLGSMPRA